MHCATNNVTFQNPFYLHLYNSRRLFGRDLQVRLHSPALLARLTAELNEIHKLEGLIVKNRLEW